MPIQSAALTAIIFARLPKALFRTPAFRRDTPGLIGMMALVARWAAHCVFDSLLQVRSIGNRRDAMQ